MCESSEKIFDEFERVDVQYCRPTESWFSFLNRVDNPVFAKIRNETEKWFSHLDYQAQKELNPRIRSGNAGQEMAAYWELYLHEILLRSGYALEAHPDIPGETKHPDFLASKSQTSFYLEATSVGGAQKTLGENKQQEMVVEYLNKNIKADFYLHVLYLTTHQKTPSLKKIKSELLKWLATLDVDEVLQNYSEKGWPNYIWSDGNWEIRFRAKPKPEWMRKNEAIRTVAMVAGGATWGSNAPGLYSVIRKKAARYGELDRPYIVAAMLNEFFVHSTDIRDALFGTVSMAVRISDSGEALPFESWTPDGIWQGPNGSQNTRLSAVLISGAIDPLSVLRQTPVLIHNPYASWPLHEVPDVWPQWIVDVETGKIERRPAAKSTAQVLGLAEDWPGEPW